MHIFKWSTSFQCSEESPVVHFLPYLLVYFIHWKDALFSITNAIDKPFQLTMLLLLLRGPQLLEF